MVDKAQQYNTPSKAQHEQFVGMSNAEMVKATIRALIHEHGRPFSRDDRTPCFPRADLATSVRLLMLNNGVHLSLTTIRDNIATYTAPVAGAPFVVMRDPDNIEVVIETPTLREEPSRARPRMRSRS